MSELDYDLVLAENIRMREALEALVFYLRQPHQHIGEQCGIDACVVCLAESTVHDALKPVEGKPTEMASSQRMSREEVNALMEWLRSDSLDWDAVERAREEGWR